MTDDIASGGSGTPGPVGGVVPVFTRGTPASQERRASGPEKNAAAAPSGDGQAFAVFTGSGWGLFGIHLRNVVLSLLTLGVYSFWGKARMRRYLWENTEVLGEPLEYTGTGGELFKSFLLVMLLGILGMAVFSACGAFLPFAAPVVLYFVLIPVGHFASFQALRYRLTRTRWRGIRGNMGGSSGGYAVAGTGYSLLTFATLFLCLPLETARLAGKRCNAALFGSRRFRFSGTSGPLYASWLQSYLLLALLLGGAGFLGYGAALAAYETAGDYEDVFRIVGLVVLVCIPLAGIMSVIYKAAVVRWLFANLAYGDMRFDASSYTAWRLFTLTLSNGFLLVVTLGLAYPWTAIRSLRFFLTSIRHTGDPELRKLLQDELPERSRGEGLLDALDMDVAF